MQQHTCLDYMRRSKAESDKFLHGKKLGKKYCFVGIGFQGELCKDPNIAALACTFYCTANVQTAMTTVAYRDINPWGKYKNFVRKTQNLYLNKKQST